MLWLIQWTNNFLSKTIKIFFKKYSKLFFGFYKSRVNNSNLINSQQGSRGVVARIAAFQAGVPGSIPSRFHIFASSHKDQRLSHFFHSHRHISTQIFLSFFLSVSRLPERNDRISFYLFQCCCKTLHNQYGPAQIPHIYTSTHTSPCGVVVITGACQAEVLGSNPDWYVNFGVILELIKHNCEKY